jgi:hypothetical protein
MNKEFSFRASQIIEDTLNAIQQADELGGLELEEYISVMKYLANELHERKNCAMSNLIKKNHLRLEATK